MSILLASSILCLLVPEDSLSGRELKAALDKLEGSLGAAVVQALAHQFEKQGMSLEGGPYSWSQIRAVLGTIFVGEGCDLIEHLLKQAR
jgi:hypothetical protein